MHVSISVCTFCKRRGMWWHISRCKWHSFKVEVVRSKYKKQKYHLVYDTQWLNSTDNPAAIIISSKYLKIEKFNHTKFTTCNSSVAPPVTKFSKFKLHCGRSRYHGNLWISTLFVNNDLPTSIWVNIFKTTQQLSRFIFKKKKYYFKLTIKNVLRNI